MENTVSCELYLKAESDTVLQTITFNGVGHIIKDIFHRNIKSAI